MIFFLLKASVSRVNRRSCIRHVRLARSRWLVEMRSGFGLPMISFVVIETTRADGLNQSGPSVVAAE